MKRMKMIISLLIAAVMTLVGSYDVLAAEEPSLDDELKTALQSGLTKIIPTGNHTESELQTAADQAINRYAAFQLGKTPIPYASAHIRQGQIIMEYDERYVSDEKVDIDRIRSDQQKIEAHYQDVLSVVVSDMSDLEKALALHDKLILLTDFYDKENINPDEAAMIDGPVKPDPSIAVDYEDSAVGVFRDGYSGSQGYADAYRMLLDDVGVENVQVKNETRVWNMVKINEAYYHVDCCHDDPTFTNNMTYMGDNNADYWDIGNVSHTYFMKTDTEMQNLGYSDIESEDNISSALTDIGVYLFFGNNSYLSYDNGLWYYTDYNRRGVAYGKLTDTQMNTISLEDQLDENELIKYSFVIHSQLYVMTNQHILTCHLDGTSVKELVSAGNGRLTEMRVVQNTIEYIIEKSDKTFITETTALVSDTQSVPADNASADNNGSWRIVWLILSLLFIAVIVLVVVYFIRRRKKLEAK
ncbi:MAG: hypothetical protein II711_00960 [Clostridia bacterium]|nr:hypothetical protein [Clostridia bacterium]